MDICSPNRSDYINVDESAIFQNNKIAVESRAEIMLAAKWCLSTVVLTKMELEKCPHPWGNCAEYIPWIALHGRKTQRPRVTLYSHTIQLEERKVIFSCLKCQWVTNVMDREGMAPIVVEKIKDDLNRTFVAMSLGFMLSEDSPKHLLSGIKLVQMYGFDHIIIVGELPYGILFFDCYGRVFEWSSMVDVSYFHEDDIEAAKRKYVGPELWGVEFDGTIVVINEGIYIICTFFFLSLIFYNYFF
jgi:hypothetical protein